MTRSTGQRRFHFKNVQPRDPAVKPRQDWCPPNRAFYSDFRRWLKEASYSDSALNIYGCAARLALGWLDKPYWQIDPADLDRVRAYIAQRYESQATRDSYLKGIAKLDEYLYHRCRRTPPPKQIEWETYVGPLPDWLAQDVRAYVTHCQRAWLPDNRYRATKDLLSRLTRSLRWMAARAALGGIGDLTPHLWYEYVDARLNAGIQPTSTNGELAVLYGFLRHLANEDRPVCQRMLRVDYFKVDRRMPRDVPLDQLKRVMAEIEVDAGSSRADVRRKGVMDRAWFFIMLHSGLRTCEVRHLRRSDLNLEERKVRIEQSKGLKDRIVWLSRATIDALDGYMEVRGPAQTDHVFIFRHGPLTPSYCGSRLRTLGQRCGITITPHAIRHTCATLLLNAGAPVLTVQAILGHKHIDTTMGYARLYDGTVAADYYRAMDEVEARMALQTIDPDQALNSGQLLALVDSLFAGTLNDAQRETVYAIRSGILTLAEQTV